MDTQTQLATKIATAKAELAKLEDERDKFDGLTPAQKLATELHTIRCHWNHTDGCSWFYEDLWTGYAHTEYLEKATNVLDVTDFDTALQVIKLT